MDIAIAVCDDNKTESEYLAKLAREWASAKYFSAVISEYGSAEAFLFSYGAEKPCDILLLDIQMGGVDGVTLAKRLRGAGDSIQIIFTTGLPDFIDEGYDVSALHYLIKPVNPTKLEEVLDRAAAAIQKLESPVLIDTAEGPLRLFARDIYYAEAFAHATELHTANGAVNSRTPISELEKRLGGEFIRTHRSYLAALRHIRQITKTGVVMDDGSAVPLSRQRYAQANRAFIKYYKGAE